MVVEVVVVVVLANEVIETVNTVGGGTSILTNQQPSIYTFPQQQISKPSLTIFPNNNITKPNIISTPSTVTAGPKLVSIPTLAPTKNIIQNKKIPIPPSKLKDGDKVKTPDSHPNEFQKNKDGSYTHKKTGWEIKKDPTQHGGPHWDVSPSRSSGHIRICPNR